MKKIVLLLILSNFLVAQNYDWVKVDTLNISTNPTFLARSVELDPSGNIISSRLIESKLSYGSNYYGDFIIEKFDQNGNLIWHKDILGKVNIYDLKIDNKNNLYVIGAFLDSISIDSSQFNIGTPFQLHSFILKLNSTGDLFWFKDYNHENPEYNHINTIGIDHNNYIWLGVRKFNQSSAVHKLDSLGNIIQFIEQTDVDVISSIDFDPIGNIYVAGSTGFGVKSYNGFSAPAPFEYNLYVGKYSYNGSVSWVNFIEDITFQLPVVACDSKGNSYLSASLFDSTTFGNISAQGPDWVFDFFFAKIDSSGNYIWLKEVSNQPGSPIGDATIGKAQFVHVDNNDNIYLSGVYRGFIDWGNGIISNSNTFLYSSFLNKYNSFGDILWTKSGISPGYDRGDDIVVDNNGNTFYTGITSDSVFFDSLLIRSSFVSIFLAKITPNATSLSNEISKQIPINLRMFQNYPNPFNPSTTIRFELNKKSNVKLNIFNSLGQKVETLFSGNLKSGKHLYSWNASGYASGIYFMQIESENFVLTKKITFVK